MCAWHWEHLLEDLIRSERETELRRRPQDTGGTALEEGLETLFLPHGSSAVTEASVFGLTLASFDLKTCLDHVAGCRQVGSGHTGDGTGRQELDNTELVSGRFTEQVGLQMRICREVDGRERD